MPYCIKAGYRHNGSPQYFIDDTGEIVWQPDVYPFAQQIALDRDIRGIVDIGCGRAGKLAALQAQRPDWRYVGIDYGANIEWCRERYGWGEWLEEDFDRPHAIDAEDAVIVCADVIEHLREPEHLLAAIHESGCVAAVLSTPERERAYCGDHDGPPTNPCHVREWTLEEFGKFLRSSGFEVEHLGVTRSNDVGGGDKTTLARVRPR